MNTFVKRLQTRASRKGIKVSMQQVRDVYQSVVNDLEKPTTEELDLVLAKLESSFQEVDEPIAIPEPAITNITKDSNADIWEILQPPDDAIASDQLEREEESLAMGEQTLSEVHPKVEETQPERVEPARALTTTGGFALPEEDKHSLIHRQASALNVELNTSEITTIAGHIADNYSSFEDACRRIQSVILMVLDQRFERASGVLDNTLLTILNRASGNFQSLNGRASQGFSAIAQELKRVDTDFKSQSAQLERNLKQYLLNS
jgi:hypothetical protein